MAVSRLKEHMQKCKRGITATHKYEQDVLKGLLPNIVVSRYIACRASVLSSSRSRTKITDSARKCIMKKYEEV